jgi:hypothetical protein
MLRPAHELGDGRCQQLQLLDRAPFSSRPFPRLLEGYKYSAQQLDRDNHLCVPNRLSRKMSRRNVHSFAR